MSRCRMLWDSCEAAEVVRLVAAIAAEDSPRHAALHGALQLRLTAAASFEHAPPYPPKPGAVLACHLLAEMGFDSTRLFEWRMEHKLTQALVLERCCPGVMPVSCGLGRTLAGTTRAEARRRLTELRREAVLIKPTLGEASGERRLFDQHEAALQDLDEHEGTLSSMRSVCTERFFVQEQLDIGDEYRVHSLEDRVVPDLTFLRYAPRATSLRGRLAANDFVQRLLDRLPNALVHHTMYGWDVAIDTRGRWWVIEANPAGYHPIFKRGFHCSGFLQMPGWSAPVAARLLRFVGHRYGVPVEIAIDVRHRSDTASTYWWTAHCLALLDALDGGAADPVANVAAETDPQELVPEQIDPVLTMEENVFAWAVAVCRRARASIPPQITPPLKRIPSHLSPALPSDIAT